MTKTLHVFPITSYEDYNDPENNRYEFVGNNITIKNLTVDGDDHTVDYDQIKFDHYIMQTIMEVENPKKPLYDKLLKDFVHDGPDANQISKELASYVRHDLLKNGMYEDMKRIILEYREHSFDKYYKREEDEFDERADPKEEDVFEEPVRKEMKENKDCFNLTNIMK
eukprot:GHVR01091385.1.p2 GENE.GHVR01091385.1~~GHVR01091385.1.p2  ORF type:complete len:167 (-),score=24.48 GHVR01091385.1:1697-2197(-)